MAGTAPPPPPPPTHLTAANANLLHFRGLTERTQEFKQNYCSEKEFLNLNFV
jgi:hypothetical protein